MALSDKRILEEMKKGDIVISPFDRSQLATSSYDVTLGEYFFREQPPKYNHSLYNIWNQEHMEHVWGADKVERAVSAKEAFKKYNFDWTGGIRPDDKVVVLRPGETILAHTNEFIGDYDGNCAADGNDYLVWQRQFGSIVSPYTGADGNGNGVVDAADYVVWRSKFGSSCLKGDMDYSGVIDNDDEMVFFQAVTNPTAYQKEYGYPPSFAGDFTGDNNVTFDDITGFNAVMAKRPLVNAGEDALLRFPNGTSIGLHGSATARSGSGQPLVAQWSVKYGDPEVVFSDTNSYSPTASVNRLGRYTLRLTVQIC
jgi:hypothetical protein